MFAKVFEQIFDSSLAENWKTRLVFEDMLVLADMNGVVDRTPEAISRRTNVPLDIVNEAITVLEAPDPRSRSSTDDGRRLIRLDEHRNWGWMITNYEYYRGLASEEQRRAKTAERVRRHRAKSQHKRVCNAPVTLVNDSPSASASASSSLIPSSLPEGSAEGRRNLEKEFLECWQLYPDKSGKREAWKAYLKACQSGTTQAAVLSGLNRYLNWLRVKREDGFKDLKAKNGSTWFNQRCWEDEYTVMRKEVGNGMPIFK